MTGLRDELKFAVRRLRKTPIASAVAIVSLALGIGGTTAVFSLADALLFRPFPTIAAPQTIVAAVGVHAKDPDRRQMLSFADYREYASQTGAVRGLAAFADFDVSLTHRGPAERIAALAVSGSYFDVLHLVPAQGRLLGPADDRAPVAVLGFSLWRRLFGGNPAAVGATVALNGKNVTIVGIAPQGFAGTDLRMPREVWVPLGTYTNLARGILAPFTGGRDHAQEWLHTVGRLAPGVNLTKAQAVFEVTARQLAAAWPATNRERTVRLLPLAEVALGGPDARARQLVQAYAARLMAVAGSVLAVAALNVAALLLARSLARRQETAVRLSLGASRWQLTRQLLVEALALAILGGGAGVALAWMGLPVLKRIQLPAGLAVRDFTLSARVLSFAVLVAVTTCVVFALAPTLQTLRTALVPALRGEAPRARRFGVGLREVLVSLQLAAAFLILLAAGLLIHSLANLESIAPGFEARHVLAATIDLAPTPHKGPKAVALYADLLERLRRFPGVLDASMVSALPVMGADLEVNLGVSPADVQLKAGLAGQENQPAIRHVLVGSRYFHTVGLPILRGRDFGPQDDASDVGAVILNQAAARVLWHDRDALGRQVRLLQTDAPFTVVGLVADATYANLKEGHLPILYLAHSQSAKSFIGDLLASQMTVLVRAVGDPWQMLPAVREAVRQSDADLPVFQAATLEDLLGATIGVERQAAVLYGGFAAIAVGLAMLGLFGALNLAITERTREIGVRVACGATPANVRRLVLSRTSWLTLVGLVLGALAAIPSYGLVDNLLYHVAADDPTTWCLSAIAIAAVALVVSAAPCTHAVAIDPVVALKHE